ncbi:MAG: UDP-N-acetylglucosamine--dolichyl-phosphate N-acetylglucosaminephosphotransferase [Thaumarchaeota archaeon]|nr:UDP-N-acetylglucosamine--dolichyl-phosphate N-acetylglucosaminephosphotransferase [Nitrososphaerota archaeon]
MNIAILSAASILSAIVAYLLTRYLSVRMRSLGMTGVDIHKPDAPERAEMGGLAVVVAGFVGSAVLVMGGLGIGLAILGPLLTLGLVGCVGVIDDVLGIRQRTKPALLVVASIPLAYSLLGRSAIVLPLMGTVPLGLLYPLVVVPLAVTSSSNFTNMLAGFNGLEAGIGTIGIATVSGLAWLNGSPEIAALGFVMSAAFVGFLALNWFPARIFPGDTGTLFSGAALATVGLVGGVEPASVILSIPAAMDFTLKMLSKNPFQGRQRFGNTSVDSGGVLSPPAYPALAHAFMRVGRLSERRLVVSILAMEAVYAIVAIYVQTVVI